MNILKHLSISTPLGENLFKNVYIDEFELSLRKEISEEY